MASHATPNNAGDSEYCDATATKATMCDSTNKSACQSAICSIAQRRRRILQQLLNRRWIVQHIDRPPARIEQLQARVDAQDVVDRGVNVARRERARVRPLPKSGRGADDGAAPNPAPPSQAQPDVAP